MTIVQERKFTQFLYWGLQATFGIILSIGVYTYTSDLKKQAEYNRKNDKKVLEMQKQVLELIKNEAATTQILIWIKEEVKDNKETMKDRFDKLEDKIDKIK